MKRHDNACGQHVCGDQRPDGELLIQNRERADTGDRDGRDDADGETHIDEIIAGPPAVEPPVDGFGMGVFPARRKCIVQSKTFDRRPPGDQVTDKPVAGKRRVAFGARTGGLTACAEPGNQHKDGDQHQYHPGHRGGNCIDNAEENHRKRQVCNRDRRRPGKRVTHRIGITEQDVPLRNGARFKHP